MGNRFLNKFGPCIVFIILFGFASAGTCDSDWRKEWRNIKETCKKQCKACNLEFKGDLGPKYDQYEKALKDHQDQEKKLKAMPPNKQEDPKLVRERNKRVLSLVNLAKEINKIAGDYIAEIDKLESANQGVDCWGKARDALKIPRELKFELQQTSTVK